MRFFVVAITVLFLGCQDVQRPEKPENLIPQDKMAAILADVYVGNAAKSVNTWLIKDKGIQLDTYIYEKHGVDSLQFVLSNEYYTSDLDAYHELFVKVEAKLALLKEEKDSLKAEYDRTKRLNTVKRDSAAKSKPKQLVEPVKSGLLRQDSIE